MRIERIAAAGKDRWRLTFEDGEKLAVTGQEMSRFALHTGMELDEEQAEELRAAAIKSGLRDQALRLVSARAYSRSELIQRLVRKGAQTEDAEDVARWLTMIGLINDRQYAATVVEHYSETGWGIRKILSELQKRGISGELRDEALLQCPEPGPFLRDYLRENLDREAERKEVQKVCAALERRGFLREDIREALDHRYDPGEDYEPIEEL